MEKIVNLYKPTGETRKEGEIICKSCRDYEFCTNHNLCKDFRDDTNPRVVAFVEDAQNAFFDKKSVELKASTLNEVKARLAIIEKNYAKFIDFYDTFKLLCNSGTRENEIDMCVDDFFELEFSNECRNKNQDCGSCWYNHLEMWERDKIKLKERNDR